MGNSSSSGRRAQPKVGFEDTAILMILMILKLPWGGTLKACFIKLAYNCNVATINKEGFGTQSNFGCSHACAANVAVI